MFGRWWIVDFKNEFGKYYLAKDILVKRKADTRTYDQIRLRGKGKINSGRRFSLNVSQFFNNLLYHIATKISAIWFAMRTSIFAVSMRGAQYDNIALQGKYEKKNSKWLVHKARQKINDMFSFELQQQFWLNEKWV